MPHHFHRRTTLQHLYFTVDFLSSHFPAQQFLTCIAKKFCKGVCPFIRIKVWRIPGLVCHTFQEPLGTQKILTHQLLYHTLLCTITLFLSRNGKKLKFVSNKLSKKTSLFTLIYMHIALKHNPKHRGDALIQLLMARF